MSIPTIQLTAATVVTLAQTSHDPLVIQNLGTGTILLNDTPDLIPMGSFKLRANQRVVWHENTSCYARAETIPTSVKVSLFSTIVNSQ